MAILESLLQSMSHLLWGFPMLVLLFGTHIFFTIRLRGIQRYLPTAIRMTFQGEADAKGDVSHFRALATSLAATMGPGNIIGVATAIALGGPGAVFWLWMTGILGISTKYAEAVLAVKYRVKRPDGTMAGGAMYALEYGLGQKWLGILFAIFTVIASFGIANTVPANSIASMLESTFSVDRWITAIVLAGLTALVILGGIKSVARACSALVPVMAAVYIFGCLGVIAIHIENLPSALGLIVRMAFTGEAATGGAVGSAVLLAIRWGITRGLYSNESGMGSAPILAAAAKTRNPVRQALVSSTGTFWDTVVVCALTGIAIVISGVWKDQHEGAAITEAAFATLPVIGPFIVTFSLLTFVLSTLFGWSYYGEKSLDYLLGPKSILPYRILWIVAVFVGAQSTHLEIFWSFADVANALMAIPNLIALLLLSNVIVAETRHYLWSGNLDEEA